MQLGLPCGNSHLCNHLPFRYLVPLSDKPLCIVAVGAEKVFIMFDDNKLARANQSTATVDDGAIGGGCHRRAGAGAYTDP